MLDKSWGEYSIMTGNFVCSPAIGTWQIFGRSESTAYSKMEDTYGEPGI